MTTELIKRALSETVTPYGASMRYGAMKCPRAGWLRQRGVRYKERPDYFELGSLVHSALAYTALGAMAGNVLDCNDVLDACIADGRPAHLVAEARRLMAAYFAKWGELNAGYGDAWIIDVERPLSCVIDGDVPHTARADAIIALGQHIVIVDHKTVARLSSESDETLARGWRTRPQFLGLVAAYRAETGELPTVLVNQITKTKVPQFRRVFIDFTHEQVDAWAFEHARMARWLEQSQGCANYSACDDGLRRCEYFLHCHGTEEEKRSLFVYPDDGA